MGRLRPGKPRRPRAARPPAIDQRALDAAMDAMEGKVHPDEKLWVVPSTHGGLVVGGIGLDGNLLINGDRLTEDLAGQLRERMPDLSDLLNDWLGKQQKWDANPPVPCAHSTT